MNLEAINKSIKQMRQMFGLFSILCVLGMLLSFYSCGVLANQGDNGFGSALWGIVLLVFSFAYSQASGNLKKPDPKAYKRAVQCSVVLIFFFPVFTYFGVSYLIKLSKPEFKQAFGKLETDSSKGDK
jgi:hypothetical protein